MLVKITNASVVTRIENIFLTNMDNLNFNALSLSAFLLLVYVAVNYIKWIICITYLFFWRKKPQTFYTDSVSILPNHFKTCTIMLTNVLTVKRTLHVSFVKCPYLVYFIRNLENTSTCTDKSKVSRNHSTYNKFTLTSHKY